MVANEPRLALGHDMDEFSWRGVRPPWICARLRGSGGLVLSVADASGPSEYFFFSCVLEAGQGFRDFLDD